jgi:glycosyltransferase involved in cell wall biosynthesis
MNNSRPVRVLHVIDGLAGGGCERWVWDIVRLSDAEKFAHRVVSMEPDTGDFVYADRLRGKKAYYQSPSPRLLKFLKKKIDDLVITKRLVLLRKFMSLTWRLGCYALAAKELLKSLIRFRPDVIHTHGFYGFTGGLIAKVVFNKPMIHTVPCLLEQMADANHHWTPYLYARTQRWVDYFFTGASRGGELLSLGVPSSKIIFNRGGVDIQTIDKVRDARHVHYSQIRDSLGLPSHACIALSVGRFHPSKGHLFALEALAELFPRFPNLHWIVLGEGPQRSDIEAKAEELGVMNRVHFVGFRADPLPYYAAANVYLRTPIFEAENLSSCQAIAMGLPVVGFDTGRETELINTIGNGILVSNRNSAALAEGIEKILSFTDRGQSMGELGVEFGRNNFDLRQTTLPFFSAYAALGNGNKLQPQNGD